MIALTMHIALRLPSSPGWVKEPRGGPFPTLSTMTRIPFVVQWQSPASPPSEKSMLVVLVAWQCRLSGGMLLQVSKKWLMGEWQDEETHGGYAQLEREGSFSKLWRIEIVQLRPDKV